MSIFKKRKQKPERKPADLKGIGALWDTDTAITVFKTRVSNAPLELEVGKMYRFYNDFGTKSIGLVIHKEDNDVFYFLNCDYINEYCTFRREMPKKYYTQCSIKDLLGIDLIQLEKKINGVDKKDAE